jgi:hypothetical protein
VGRAGTETRAAGSSDPGLSAPTPPDPNRNRAATARPRTTVTGGLRSMTKVSWQHRAPAEEAMAPARSSSQNSSVTGQDPVVGWLVAYDGPLQGCDFRIRVGNNSIGRDPANRICLYEADLDIHRKPHAYIVYDPVTNNYALRAGDQQRLVYVREEASYGSEEPKWNPVWNAVELKPYDEIRIGKSKFVFVPLCGENFKWDLPNE